MTATPIPRTLAMTVFADLDVSIIDELPPGRPPVRTHVISVARRAEIIGRIESACAAGRQAYWVCPLIEESDALQCRAAVETRRSLVEALPGRRIGLLHGRMKAAEKEREMRAFKSGETEVLVATTVIEVGVDVPNASLMIVENAERLGLSQLHQLRGRVGRGSRDSDCLLMYQPPLGDTARERLETMRLTTDGFRIAEKDLELRGPGELLGTRQTGLQGMRVASLARDARMIPQVQRAAEALLRYQPEFVDPLVRRWVSVDRNLGAV
jgi:ATP-dependent DNA helicase RecG